MSKKRKSAKTAYVSKELFDAADQARLSQINALRNDIKREKSRSVFRRGLVLSTLFGLACAVASFFLFQHDGWASLSRMVGCSAVIGIASMIAGGIWIALYCEDSRSRHG